MITIGIDPHKSSITAAAMDEASTQLAVCRLAVNAGTAKQLIGWAVRWPQRRFVIEGADELGRGVAQTLEVLAATQAKLQQIPGVGPVFAAKILGHVGDIGRVPGDSHFASYTGTAPLNASSGTNYRHRLNTGKNRQLNAVLHIMAICQSRYSSPAGTTTSGNRRRENAKRSPPSFQTPPLKHPLPTYAQGPEQTCHSTEKIAA